MKPAMHSNLKSVTWRAFRRVETMLFLFFELGQPGAERAGFYGYGERPSR
jgi:hypothetical protein